MASLAKSDVLSTLSVTELQEASQNTKLAIRIQGGKIVMPSKSGETTELMRFLNDGRYVGPVSRDVFITNSHRSQKCER